MPGTVHVVHCIDTEGPLHESIEATFERLGGIFGLDLEPSTATLRQLQAGTLDLNGLEAAVKQVVDPHLLAYNDTWTRSTRCSPRAFGGLPRPAAGFAGRAGSSTGSAWIMSTTTAIRAGGISAITTSSTTIARCSVK